MTIKVKFIKTSPNAIKPEYAHIGDSGADLFVAEDAEWIPIYSDLYGKNIVGFKTMVNTGLAVQLPEGFEMQIRAKSGIASKYNIIIPNGPSTIDTGYRGTITIPLLCVGFYPNDPKFFPVIKKGTKIAQAILARNTQIPYEEVKELDSSDRGTGGFGSTGI